MHAGTQGACLPPHVLVEGMSGRTIIGPFLLAKPPRAPKRLGCPRGRTVCCTRAVQKVRYFVPIFPDGQGDTVPIVFPYKGLLRFLLSPKTQIMS